MSSPSEGTLTETPTKKLSSDPSLTMIPPQELIAFPPLAYLLNTLLIGLNHLKDCPLLSLQAPLVSQLRDLFSDLCGFLRDHSAEIRERGMKYFANRFGDEGTGAEATVGSRLTGAAEMNLDEIYSQQMVRNVVEHALLCFQLIYTGLCSSPPCLTMV
jgi:hypothetical protein